MSDNKAALEQLEYHANLLKVDLESAMAKKPGNIHLQRALMKLADVVFLAKVGILE